MLHYLKDYIKDKKIMILGFGKEGRSTYHVLSALKGYKSLAISDIAPLKDSFDEAVTVYSNFEYQKHLDEYDIVLKSPGVVLERDIHDYRCTVTSQTELFLNCYRNQVIGITGTKGKSTTASLLYNVLRNSDYHSILVGNIGTPVFEILDSITPETILVDELSSHQLEYTDVSPHIAALMNIYEDHLDHYGSFQKYAAAKKNIYLHQTGDDILLCNQDFLPQENTCNAHIYSVSNHGPADIQVIDNEVLFQSRRFSIPTQFNHLVGAHNYFNIGVVYAICKLLNLSDEIILEGITTFQPLPHRMELICEANGVKYFDDSISTICETTINAINSLPNVSTVLIGGMDRGIDYSKLIQFLPDCHVTNIILMYDSGNRIFDEIQSTRPELLEQKHIILTGSLKEATSLAKQLTRSGEACLLSPAAASYGLFKNFEERGDYFKEYVING